MSGGHFDHNQYWINDIADSIERELNRQGKEKPKDELYCSREYYELFCCEQAVVIANACKTAEEVKSFAYKRWDDQLKQVPELSDGHSGNTLDMACSLAYWYLANPENVVKLHGSLSSLVGYDKYGDVPNLIK